MGVAHTFGQSLFEVSSSKEVLSLAQASIISTVGPGFWKNSVFFGNCIFSSIHHNIQHAQYIWPLGAVHKLLKGISYLLFCNGVFLMITI